MKFTRLLSIFSLIFFCSSLCNVLAQAPQTPKIVFSLIDSGNSEIYLMNPDGTEQVRLTHNKAFDVSPMWSPTGEQSFLPQTEMWSMICTLWMRMEKV